jgi:hypothetical protein
MQHARAFALLVAVCPATAIRTLRAVFSTNLSLIENTFEESDSGILIVQIARVVAHQLPSSPDSRLPDQFFFESTSSRGVADDGRIRADSSAFRAS